MITNYDFDSLRALSAAQPATDIKLYTVRLARLRCSFLLPRLIPALLKLLVECRAISSYSMIDFDRAVIGKHSIDFSFDACQRPRYNLLWASLRKVNVRRHVSVDVTGIYTDHVRFLRTQLHAYRIGEYFLGCF